MNAMQATPVQQPLHVLYLSRVRLNPYVRLLAAGVERAQPSIHTAIYPTLPWRIFLTNRKLDVIHLHWAELQFSYGYPTPSQATRSLQSLFKKLRLARRRGIHIVYTVHNIDQHEDLYPDLNDQANRWLFSHADAVHVHHESTARTVRERYGEPSRMVVIPHGNYLDAYPNQVGRDEARARLDIPDEHFVYLCLGQVRPYKGLDRLIHTFNLLDPEDATLIIAGNAYTPDYARHIHSLVNGQPNIKLHTTYIDDNDLQVYFNAADACVLPYRRATTSGAALLAYSFGKPIVAPAIGPFVDLVASDRGVLFDPENGDLRHALLQIRQLDPDRAGAAAMDFASALDWTTLGAQHAAVYRSLVNAS